MRILRSFSPWVIVAGILIALALSGAVYLVVTLALASSPAQSPSVVGTGVVNLIPAPTFTPPPPTAAPTSTPSPTGTVPPPPAPGDIVVGNYVQVTGTGGDGLRVRVEPGLNSQVVFLAIDFEVFQVTDGPEEIDGYTWWYLTGPFDPGKRGWAVANYLEVIQNP